MTEPAEHPLPSDPSDPSARPEPPDPTLAAGIAQATLAERWQWSPSIIWFIPVIAALVGGWIVLQAVLERGTIINISLKSAEGLEAGKTKIKYKDVDIGDVKNISLSKDHSQVIVTAQLTKGSDSLMRQDTLFWVVRPRIGTGGISGLGTLLSGSYIGVDVGKSEEDRSDFVGLDAPPPILSGLAGRYFVLHSEQIGSLDIGAPLLFRHIQAGQVIGYNLDKNGKGITMNVFVNAPYDQYVRRNSLFWHASGVELTLDANGVKLQTESLATIITGGISFDAPSDGPQALPNAEFTLFANRQKAMTHPDTEVRKVLLYFKESVRGLLIGAPVDFHGIVIGDVQAVHLEYDDKAKTYRFPVEVNIYPARLRTRSARGAAAPVEHDNGDQVLRRLFDNGLRAQLKTGNLLTGSLYVGLDFFPDSPKTKINWKHDPLVLATAPGALDELQASLVSIAHKIDQLPLADLSADLRKAVQTLNTTLESVDKLVKHLDNDVAPQANETMKQVRKTLAGVDHTLSDDSNLQRDLHETLREVSRAAQALRTLSDTLERHPESLLRGKQADKQEANQ
jgi:paraquat-inducible protein B